MDASLRGRDLISIAGVSAGEVERLLKGALQLRLAQGAATRR